MKKYLYLLLTCFAIACSDEEDVSPSGIEQNMFASPDFSSEELDGILADYASTDRRFGGLNGK